MTSRRVNENWMAKMLGTVRMLVHTLVLRGCGKSPGKEKIGIGQLLGRGVIPV